jgi:hypothetical protein
MDFEPAKSPNNFMDSANFGYDIGLVDTYMQYPHSPSALGREFYCFIVQFLS